MGKLYNISIYYTVFWVDLIYNHNYGIKNTEYAVN